ncbi:unnamed protein product [Symbiodinium sp. CCMP2592]|nr:unnamed protein product [Symbiodinium sp. CCMP2592]
MKEMLALGEKVATLKEKLASLPEDKKERAKETLGISSSAFLDKLNDLKGKVDVLYEKITDISARVEVNKSVDKKDEKCEAAIMDVLTNAKCSVWNGLDRSTRPLLRKPKAEKKENAECPKKPSATAKFMADAVGSGVPCKKMVDLAKALDADGLGAFQSAGCDFVQKVARLKTSDAEEKMHGLLEAHGLSLPIPLDTIMNKKDLNGFPRLKPLNIFAYMAETGHLNKLLGGRSPNAAQGILTEFWSNYQKIHPDFELFDKDDSILLQDCIPIMAHIDGGRGYKKSENMIFDWSAVIGSGRGKKSGKDPGIRSFRKVGDKARLALLGHSYETHYLYASMPAAFHKANESAFQQLLETFAEDLLECFEEGIAYQGRVLRLVLLGLKGDLKMQVRAGRLTRWYSTARKKPLDPSKPMKVTGQCCPWCLAGDISLPFEDIGSKLPAWKVQKDLEQQAGVPEPPWTTPGGMLLSSLGYKRDPAKFYLPDLFHIYLAGVGQDFAASCLVYLLPICFAGPMGDNSVEAQLEICTKSLQQWRKEAKAPLHLTVLNREKLTYTDNTKYYPTGTWSKCADTTTLVRFIQYVCSQHPDKCKRDVDPIMLYMQQACDAVGGFMQGLYNADLWIAALLHMLSSSRSI